MNLLASPAEVFFPIVHGTWGEDGTLQGLLEVAQPLIRQRGLTLVGLAVGNLSDARAVQLALPFDAFAGGALDAAVDGVRERFGSAAVTRAAQLGQRQGFTVPMLPD